MKCELQGTNLVITIPTHDPQISSTGKTMSVAGTGGFKATTVFIDGKMLMVSVNTYVKASK